MPDEKIVFRNDINSPTPISIVKTSIHKKLDPQLNTNIKSHWQSKKEKAYQSSFKLWNGTVYSLDSWQLTNGSLTLTIGETTYKETLGTHENDPKEIVALFGRKSLTNTLVVTSSIVTLDNKLIFGKRSQGVIESNKLSTFGGSMNKTDVVIETGNDFIVQLKKELNEELGLQNDMIGKINFLGLAEDSNYYQQLHFQTFVTISYKHLQEIFSSTKDNEHNEILAILNSKTGIKNFMKKLRINNSSGALRTHLLFLNS